MKTKDLLCFTLTLMFAVLLAACGDDNNAAPDEEDTALPKLVKTDKRLRYIKILVPQAPNCNQTNRFDYDADGYLTHISVSSESDGFSTLDYTWSGGRVDTRIGVPFESGLRYYFRVYTFKNSRAWSTFWKNTFWEADTCRFEYSVAGNLVRVHGLEGLDIRVSYNGKRIAKITRTMKTYNNESIEAEWTYSYDGMESNGMCYNVYVDAVISDYGLPDGNVFFVHPELIGLRNRYLPSSVHVKKKGRFIWGQEDTTCDITYRWVVDKDKRLEKGYMQMTEIRESEYDVSSVQSNGVERNGRASKNTTQTTDYAEEYEFVWE